MNEKVRELIISPRRTDMRIRRIEAKIGELKTCLYLSGIRYDADRVQTSVVDQMAEVFSKISELETRLCDLKLMKAKEVMAISDAIEMLDDENEKTVLCLLYIKRMSVKQVASIMNYSERSVYYFKRHGCNHLSELKSLQ